MAEGHDQVEIAIGYPYQPYFQSYYQTQAASNFGRTVRNNSAHPPTDSHRMTITEDHAELCSSSLTSQKKMLLFETLLVLSAGFLALCFIILRASEIIEFRAPKFEVDAVTVHPFNISSSSQITANWNISLFVENPKFTSFYYEDMEASVLVKNESVCSTIVGNLFLDGSHEQGKLVQANLAASSVSINQTVADAVTVEKREEETVTFSLVLNVTGRMYPRNSDGEIRHMVVSCEDLKVGFISNSQVGNLIGGRIACNVHIHKYNIH